jgi:tetratricopeptide (TPR) repeat protein
MQDLEADLRRYLAHEPILARPPGWPGRARRWARRHPARAMALALGGAALCVFAALFWRTVEALEREARANALLATSNDDLRLSRDAERSEREVSDEALRVLSDAFLAADPALYGRQEPTVREFVAQGVARLRAGQPASPQARARLAATLGTVLDTLGDWPGALELLSESDRTWRELGLADHPEAHKARSVLAEVLMSLGRNQEALPVANELVEAWRAGRLDPAPAAKALETLGLIEFQAAQYAQARAHLQEALALDASLSGADPLSVALTRSMLARVDMDQRRFAEGLALIEPDLELVRPLLDKGNPLALDLFNMHGLFLQGLGRTQEAELVLEECLDASERALGADHPRSLNLRINLGTVLQDLGRLDDAEALLRESRDLATERFGPLVPESRVATNDLAQCLIVQGRLAEAEALLRVLLEDTERARGAEHFESGRVRYALATCLALLRRPAEAVELAEQALEAIPPEFPQRATMEQNLAIWRELAAAAAGG